VVLLNGKNVNLEMLKAGLAEVYRGDPPRGLDMKPFLNAEKQAREAKRGMWSQGTKYVSPKNWRAALKEK
jgi:endonuclease YncB( thermonuclease family)